MNGKNLEREYITAKGGGGGDRNGLDWINKARKYGHKDMAIVDS